MPANEQSAVFTDLAAKINILIFVFSAFLVVIILLLTAILVIQVLCVWRSKAKPEKDDIEKTSAPTSDAHNLSNDRNRSSITDLRSVITDGTQSSPNRVAALTSSSSTPEGDLSSAFTTQTTNTAAHSLVAATKKILTNTAIARPMMEAKTNKSTWTAVPSPVIPKTSKSIPPISLLGTDTKQDDLERTQHQAIGMPDISVELDGKNRTRVERTQCESLSSLQSSTGGTEV